MRDDPVRTTAGGRDLWRHVRLARFDVAAQPANIDLLAIAPTRALYSVTKGYDQSTGVTFVHRLILCWSGVLPPGILQSWTFGLRAGMVARSRAAMRLCPNSCGSMLQMWQTRIPMVTLR